MYRPRNAIFAQPSFIFTSILRLLLVILISQITISGLFAQSVFHSEIVELAKATNSKFPFGVASGDPGPDRVVLWTKVFTENLAEAIDVNWVIATDTTLKNVVGGGSLAADSSSAFTIQVDQQGLQPATTYFYCFFSATDSSAIGRTRTASANGESLRFIVASCANYQMGYFNAYGHIAKQTNIDAVLFLGDYIYEYGTRSNAIRPHIPSHEILTLEDYRSRYAQYRLDSNLQEAHRLHPFITIWDDHEFANDSYQAGAQNHQEEEADWEQRKTNARRAFFEWIPIKRQPGTDRLYRQLNYGNMAELFMIDGRVEGRSQPLRNYKDSLRYDTTRSMLGSQQREWLLDGISKSKARWRLLVNDVMFAPIDLGEMAKERRFNMDAWDGYAGERNLIFDALERDSVRNLIVVTGDIHTAWALELTRNPGDKKLFNRSTGLGLLGAEFVTPSISSPNLDEMRGKLAASMAVSYLKGLKHNRHLRYANAKDHGYMLVELTQDEVKATWVFMKSVRTPTQKIKRLNSWGLPYTGNHLKRFKPKL